jgi:hypothetical protein
MNVRPLYGLNSTGVRLFFIFINNLGRRPDSSAYNSQEVCRRHTAGAGATGQQGQTAPARQFAAESGELPSMLKIYDHELRHQEQAASVLHGGKTVVGHKGGERHWSDGIEHAEAFCIVRRTSSDSQYNTSAAYQSFPLQG